MVLRSLSVVIFWLFNMAAQAQEVNGEISARALMLQGDQFRQSGDVQRALESYFASMRKGEESQDTWQIMMTSRNLGHIYEKYYRHAESIPYFKRAYNILKASDSTRILANVSNSIAWNYIKAGIMDSSLRYAEEAVRLHRMVPVLDTMSYCAALESLGEIYSFKTRFADCDRAMGESMKLGIESNNIIIQGFSNYGIALNHFNQGKLAEAKKAIKACLPVAEKYATPELLTLVYRMAYRIHDGLGLEQEALRYLRNYMDLNERLHSEDIEKKAAIVNANYEIQKKEGDLQLLAQQNSIQQLEIDQRTLAQQITIGAVIAMLIIVGLIYNRIQSQRKFEQKELLRKNEELEQARKVQLSLLPKEPHISDSFEVFGKMTTATEVGGDYFDFIRLDDRRMLIAFGDATGHGMTAGMMVTITKVALINNLALLRNSNDVVPVARAINDSILSSVSVKGIGMALQLCLIDAEANTLSMTSCGMPYPMLYEQSTGLLSTITIRQPPLGFMRVTKMELTQVEFNTQHLLLLTSDGILERFNPAREEYGLDRLQSLIRRKPPLAQQAQALLDDIFFDTDHFAEGTPNHDDMTALCARRK